MQKPKNYAEAVEQIKLLEYKNEAMSDALHEVVNECTCLRNEKQRARVFCFSDVTSGL